MRVDGADFSFGKVDEALIDLDYISKVKEPVATVRQWTGIPTIIATPPNPTISSNWLEQHKNNILTMQNWNSEEFWVTRSTLCLFPLLHDNDAAFQPFFI